MSPIRSPRRLTRLALTKVVLTGASFFAVALSSAQAQFRLAPHFRQDCCDVAPNCREAAPTTPTTPDKAPAARPPSELEIFPEARTTAALGDRDVAFSPGYLDNPLPQSHFRLRYDSARDNNRPDRAEYFYAKCGCFANQQAAGRFFDPSAAGPPLPESSVDYQDISAYLEVAGRGGRLSGFVELPVRFLNPELNDNVTGLADMNFGFKYAFISNECRVLTFQGRAYMPTGEADRGLGNDHVSLEPSLLYATSLSDRLILFGNFGVWIPIDGSDYAGNILRYGVGASYTAIDNGRISVSPVIEMLGWTVLDGLETVNGIPTDASGDTIINAKFGVRFGLGGNCGGNGRIGSPDLYIGYGRALTGEVWYQDIVRVELRMPF